MSDGEVSRIWGSQHERVSAFRGVDISLGCRFRPKQVTRVNFQHFIDAQNPVISVVLDELRAGQKRTHWMWFVFPQHVGLGQSGMARRFGLSSLEDANAYLSDPILGSRLVACTETVLAHRTKSARAIFGTPDDLKFRSCMTLFSIAAPQHPIFQRALNTFFAGECDPLTVALLA